MYYPPAYQGPHPLLHNPSIKSSPLLLDPEVEYSLYTTTTLKRDATRHTRSMSHATPSRYAYATPQRLPAYFTPTQFAHSAPVPYITKQKTPKDRTDFAAATERVRSKANRYADGPSPKAQGRMTSSKKGSPSSSQRMHKELVNDQQYEFDYRPKGTPPPPYNEDAYHHNYPGAYHTQSHTETYRQVEPPQYRMRATSHPPQPQRRLSRKIKQYTPNTQSKATAQDAAEAGIPAGYSYKNWDPTEEPIFLLGSVFDANSLGKWIYDWTVFHHGSSTPMADLAGELWLGLIELASKIKRAEECLPRIRNLEDHDLVDEFLESGERLWSRLGKILKSCEDFMWRAANKENGGNKKATTAMGAKSGCEFVDSIFGRDRKLEDTEKLMTGIRLWTMRFDTNCERILHRPKA